MEFGIGSLRGMLTGWINTAQKGLFGSCSPGVPVFLKEVGVGCNQKMTPKDN